MSNITIVIATKSDLPTLNRLYTDMDEKPLMSDKQITAIWERIQQVPDYFIYSASGNTLIHLWMRDENERDNLMVYTNSQNGVQSLHES